MKRIVQASLPAIVLSATWGSVFAAETAGREDNSMVLVYLFLATCGLIIFLQLIPVFTLVFGIIKGIFGKKQETGKPLPVKHRQ